jgi:hypothetical protein
MTPEEKERLRKQRLWEEHLAELESKKKAEAEEKARLKYNSKKRVYNRDYRAKVRLSPEAYQHRLEQHREYNRKYREAHKGDPAWKEKKREYFREWYATPAGKAKQREYYERWKEKNPEKYAAKIAKNRERRKARNGSQDSVVDA